MRYTVVLLKEPDGGYSVVVPALPGCATMGEGVPEALDMARDAISSHLRGLARAGIAPPLDDAGVSVPPDIWGDALEANVYRVTVDEVVALA